MRRRLLIALTVFATAAVLAFAIPLCLTAATSRTQQLVGDRTGDADRFAALTVTADRLGDTRALTMEVQRYHDLYDEPVLIVDARGLPIVNAGLDIHDPHVSAALAAARRNQRPATVTRLLPWSPPRVVIARPVGSDTHVEGAVLITASTTTARTDITRVWAIVAVGAIAAMAVFTALALMLSRWVLRPLARLSGAVTELTATLPKPRTPATVSRRHGGPPELRALAGSVDSMAAAVAEASLAQRRLVDDTAHAMRNPLAALTIRLDSLEPAIPAHATATFEGASSEVERLTGLLDGLLSLAVAEHRDFDPATAPTPESCDAAAVVEDRIDAWRTAFEDAGMTLTVTTPTGLSAAGATAPPADPAIEGGGAGVSAPEPHEIPTKSVTAHRTAEPVAASLAPTVAEPIERTAIPETDRAQAAVSADVLAQILDVPLSNACRYAGRGTTTRVSVDTGHGLVRITVADDGPGVPTAELDRLTTRFFRGANAAAGPGSGLGLPIAAALATSRHGSLSVRAVDPHGLAVRIDLPAHPTRDQS
ncbi:HAMP domain-containing protein [Nocardia sp. ET3-3]|uniref:histidine kinase n=1 Tax=Nocardia terrae TaxID=2675851 RepID=A0A7K1V7Q4_9NOCA|nr:HAMP domain-containing sensor histidine kinase [Nocardia terrae]MVU82492.1 HAMP domain-containing protein [Nocardia terrae]